MAVPGCTPCCCGALQMSLAPSHFLEGLWGCCSGSLPIATATTSAVVLQWLRLLSHGMVVMQQHFSCCFRAQQLLCCCSLWTAGHCSQPPPHYQCRGYGGAAPAAFLLQLPPSCRSGFSSFPTATVMQQHSSCCFRAAGAVAASLLQHVGCSSLQPTPAPLPIEGLWGCCTGSLPTGAAAATPVVLQWLRLLSCCSCPTAAFELLLPRCRCNSYSAVAACGLQLIGANPGTNVGAIGVLHQ